MRIAVLTAVSVSWRFIRQSFNFFSACGAFVLKRGKSYILLRKGRANLAFASKMNLFYLSIKIGRRVKMCYYYDMVLMFLEATLRRGRVKRRTTMTFKRRKAIVIGLAGLCAFQAQALPENVARTAKVTADSEYSRSYAARFAADGKIPDELGTQDLNAAWAVVGRTHAKGATLTFEWKEPVRVRELLYFGRTAFDLQEVFSSCELFCDEASTPVATGAFEKRHGPQRLTLPEARTVKKLRLAFKQGGGNPGAAEVMIFPEQVSQAEFEQLARSEYVSDLSFSGPSKRMKAALREGAFGFDSLILIQRRPLNPTHVYTYHVEGLARGGGLYRLDLKEDCLTRLVDASEGVILDCQVSYDGRQILFSWKRTMQAPFEIWRINVDGTGLEKVVADPSNNMNVCWLPDGGIAFMSDRKPAFAYCWTSTSPVLYRADRDGKNPVRLSANYLTDFTPSLMADGRILFSRWEYVDRPAIPIQSLWAINPDGTLLAGVFGNRVLCPATFMEAKDIPGAPGKILCVMTSHNGPCRGAIGLLDLTQGGNAQEAIRNLTPDVRLGKVEDAGAGNGMRGPYESPFPLDSRHFLVSKQGIVLLRDYDSTVDVALCLPQKGLGFYSPQPIRSRPLPKTLRPHRVEKSAEPWADIVMHNVTIGLEGYVKPGEVKRLAIVQEMEKDIWADTSRRQFGFQFPVVSCGATYAPKRVWGFATVEADGSAHFLAPANVPIYFLPLDAEGRAVQRMRTFTHFMPGEKQSCIGCHADRNYVSPTVVTSGGRSIAASRPAEKLTPPSWGAEHGFSFSRIVQPILDNHCVKCHNGAADAPKPELTGDRTDFFNVAYENLARLDSIAATKNTNHWGPNRAKGNPYTSWITTYNGCEANILEIQPKQWGSPVSKLANVVISGHPDAKGERKVKLSADEQLRLLMWIDLNVPFYGTSQSLQPDLPGCRRILPKNLDPTLKEIATRRGFELPETFYVRLDHPEKNPFLAIPLARGDFKSKEDPDYQRILSCFENVQDELEKRIEVDYRKVIESLTAQAY